MDVFVFNRPDALFEALQDEAVDVVVSAHQYSPLEPNIGVFGARGTKAATMVKKRQHLVRLRRCKQLQQQRVETTRPLKSTLFFPIFFRRGCLLELTSHARFVTARCMLL
jgi:hypothetical protein